MTENINLSNESENQENTIPSVENKEKKALEPKVVSEGDFGRADRTFQRVLTLDGEEVFAINYEGQDFEIFSAKDINEKNISDDQFVTKFEDGRRGLILLKSPETEEEQDLILGFADINEVFGAEFLKTLDYSEYFDEENAQRLAVMIAEQLIDFDSFKMDCVDVETKFGTLGVVQVSEDETVDDEDDEEPGEVIETQFTLREGGTDSDDEDGNFLGAMVFKDNERCTEETVKAKFEYVISLIQQR